MALKREQVAWRLLMLSFALCVVLGVTTRGAVLAYLHGNTRAALLTRAQMLAESGQDPAAQAVYEKLVRQYPAREEVLLAYAGYLDARERPEQAETFYQRAASTGRQRFSAVRRYAAFLERQGRTEEALAFYRAYVARYPKDGAAQFDLGVRLLRRGELAECEAHLLDAAQVPSLQIEAEGRLGQAYSQEGKIREAIGAWSRIVAGNAEPRRSVYWQDIAFAHEALGEWDDAAAAWEQYLRHFPNSLTGTQRLVEVCQRTGAQAQCQAMALRLAAMTPTVAIEQSAADRLVVTGVSEVPSPLRAGERLLADVYVRFLGDLSQEPEVRFQIGPENGTADEQLASEPRRLGPTPFWRGDALRQRFALDLPERLQPGPYRIVARFGPRFTPQIVLWTFTVESGLSGESGKAP